jgi:phage terminase small subunit
MTGSAKPSISRKDRHFAHEYMVDRNGTQAAIRCGYSPKTASSQSWELLRKPQVAEYIEKLEEEARQRNAFTLDSLVSHYGKIATADPREIMDIIVGACRYCHGTDHQYQWRTRHEFASAVTEWANLPERKQQRTPEPMDAGGYGYSLNLDPHPDCPACDGLGTQRVRIKDSRKLSEGAALLFDGVRQTQHGIEIKIKDQMAAVDQIARHLNMFATENKAKGITLDDFSTAFLAQVRTKGSKLPLNRAASQKEPDQ